MFILVIYADTYQETERDQWNIDATADLSKSIVARKFRYCQRPPSCSAESFHISAPIQDLNLKHHLNPQTATSLS